MNPPGLAIGAPPIGCSVRAASRDDLPQVIRLLESARANQDLHLDLADVVADLGADDLTVVAAVENDVVGALIGRLEGETGRILAIVVAPEWRDRRIGASLIEYAESQLFGRGARKVTALIADGRVGSLSLAERGFEAIATVTLIRLTKYDAPRLVASVDEFIYVNQEDEASEEEDDPWHPTFSGKNPMKPHYFETEEMVVKSRAVEFGWCQNRKVIGFCLVERQHIYDDPQDIMPSP